MKKFTVLLAFAFSLCLFSALVFAQAVASPVVPQLSWAELVQNISGAIGGVKGASAYTIAALVTQALVWLLESPLGAVAGKWTLTIVLLLSVVTAEIAGLVSGMSWYAALLSGGVLGAIQVLAHQIYNQFVLKGAETPAAPTIPGAPTAPTTPVAGA